MYHVNNSIESLLQTRKKAVTGSIMMWNPAAATNWLPWPLSFPSLVDLSLFSMDAKALSYCEFGGLSNNLKSFRPMSSHCLWYCWVFGHALDLDCQKQWKNSHCGRILYHLSGLICPCKHLALSPPCFDILHNRFTRDPDGQACQLATLNQRSPVTFLGLLQKVLTEL